MSWCCRLLSVCSTSLVTEHFLPVPIPALLTFSSLWYCVTEWDMETRSIAMAKCQMLVKTHKNVLASWFVYNQHQITSNNDCSSISSNNPLWRSVDFSVMTFVVYFSVVNLNCDFNISKYLMLTLYYIWQLRYKVPNLIDFELKHRAKYCCQFGCASTKHSGGSRIWP